VSELPPPVLRRSSRPDSVKNETAMVNADRTIPHMMMLGGF
jgi:hypothetical protein